METEHFSMKKLIDSLYASEMQDTDDKVIYCEIKYKRDISSFAGIALKITKENGIILVKQHEEKIIQNINKYDSIYIGFEQDYINSIKEIFSLTKKEYGIEIFFLVYSSVRSSQFIFEELMKNIDRNIDIIKRQF